MFFDETHYHIDYFTKNKACSDLSGEELTVLPDLQIVHSPGQFWWNRAWCTGRVKDPELEVTWKPKKTYKLTLCHEIPCWQSCICWKLKHITGRKQTSGPRPTKKQEPFLHNKTIDQSLCLVLTQLEPSMLGQEILRGAFWLHVFPPTLALRNPLLHFLHDSQLLAWRQRTIGRNVRQETEDRHQMLLPLHPIKPPTPFRFGCGQDILDEGRLQKPVLVDTPWHWECDTCHLPCTWFEKPRRKPNHTLTLQTLFGLRRAPGDRVWLGIIFLLLQGPRLNQLQNPRLQFGFPCQQGAQPIEDTLLAQLHELWPQLFCLQLRFEDLCLRHGS